MTTWRIGQCEIDSDHREVRVAGQRRALPPKAFALLVLLVQHRQRIVTKDEIVGEIWHGAVLSDSVLARTVMLVRRAIAEADGSPSPIKNLHGHGYRFVGEVQEDHPIRASEPLPTMLEALAPGRLALLPCRNASGDPQLNWTRYGLMAMVGDALAAAGVPTTPMSTVLQADAQLDPGLPPEVRADRMIDALGVAYVAQASLRAQPGALWLDYRLYSRHGQVSLRSLRDVSALALGERFAQETARMLQSPLSDAALFPCADPFVNEALGRANEFAAQELWTDAEALFHAALRLVPDNLDVQLQRLMCLNALMDVRGLGLGQKLLTLPAVKADANLLGQVHYALGRILHMATAPENRGRADYHLSEALCMAATRGQEAWVAALYHFNACLGLEHGDYERARAMALRAERTAEQGRHMGLRATSQHVLGLLDTVSGDMLLAQQRFETLADEHQRQRRVASACSCIGWQALCSLELGLIDAAERQADRLLELLPANDMDEVAGPLLAGAALVYAERGASAQLALVLSRFAVLDPAASDSQRVPHLTTEGAWRASRGEASEAMRLLTEALRLGTTCRSPLFLRHWGIYTLRLAMAAGQWQDAKTLRNQLSKLPGHERDPMLQGSLLHAQAFDAWRQGRRKAAMVMLGQLIEEYPSSRAQAAARADMAWLLIAEGELVRAERMLSGSGAWRQQHASGLTAQAQLQFALGNHVLAHQLHQQAVARHRGHVPACQWVLAKAYALAAAAAEGAGTAAQTQPRLPELPLWVSLSWLPQPAPAADAKPASPPAPSLQAAKAKGPTETPTTHTA